MSRFPLVFEVRKLVISILLGLLAFGGSFFTLSFSVPPFSISINWFDALPLLAGMAYGGRYGFLSATVGLGALYPFLIWADNGWACGVTSALLIAWPTVVGRLRGMRDRKPTLWNSEWLVYPLSVAAFCLLMWLLFPLAFRLNPPFWNPQAQLSMDAAILNGIAIKEFVVLLAVIFLVDLVLKLPLTRRILGLAPRREGRGNGFILASVLIGCLTVWFIFILFNRNLLPMVEALHQFQITDPHEIIALLVLLFASVFIATAIVRFAESRHRAEDHLSTLQERLSLAIRSASIGIWDWDVAENHLFWDDSMYALYGITKESFSGAYEAWSQTLHPEDREMTEKAIQAALRGEREYNLEFRIRCGNGEIKSIKADSITFRDQNGRATRMIGVNLDITTRKQLEDELRQREKMDAIGQLAGGIAHDFNNQLTGILGNTELLKMQIEDAKLRRYLDGIVRASRRAADLTAQLLAFGRRGKNLSVPTNLQKLVTEVVELLNRSVNKRIQIEQFSQEVCTVLGDPTQLQNALLNLGLNARDAMPQGGVLSFSTRIVSFDEVPPSEDLAVGRYVQVSVGDTGVGMDMATQKRIFEPFFTTKEEGKGTGLGLASVYGTIKNHRGTIQFQSELGKGSTFRIYLPAHEQVSHSSASSQSPHTVSGHGSILIVDDETTILEVCRELLSDLGYQVYVYADPVKALEFFRIAWRNIDLVLLDLVMPNLGGKELFAAMKLINSNIRALLCSGFSSNDEVQGILDQGVLGFVAKPFDRVELSQKVAQALA